METLNAISGYPSMWSEVAWPSLEEAVKRYLTAPHISEVSECWRGYHFLPPEVK